MPEDMGKMLFEQEVLSPEKDAFVLNRYAGVMASYYPGNLSRPPVSNGVRARATHIPARAVPAS
jgi:hypothetical protein